jgi:hypothetical protein
VKQRAVAIAESESDHATMGAQWNLGEGRVAALAFDAPTSAIEPLAAALARPPRDPRFSVKWNASSKLDVTIDAIDARRYLNDLDVRLELKSEDGGTQLLAIPQTAPAEYELTVEAPRNPVFAAVRVNGNVVARSALAGRYAPEFDAIGNDRRAMQTLAKQTGGAVIKPDQHLPIVFHFPVREVPLTSWLALAGAVLIGLALARWNWG